MRDHNKQSGNETRKKNNNNTNKYRMSVHTEQSKLHIQMNRPTLSFQMCSIEHYCHYSVLRTIFIGCLAFVAQVLGNHLYSNCSRNVWNVCMLGMYVCISHSYSQARLNCANNFRLNECFCIKPAKNYIDTRAYIHPYKWSSSSSTSFFFCCERKSLQFRFRIDGIFSNKKRSASFRLVYLILILVRFRMGGFSVGYSIHFLSTSHSFIQCLSRPHSILPILFDAINILAPFEMERHTHTYVYISICVLCVCVCVHMYLRRYTDERMIFILNICLFVYLSKCLWIAWIAYIIVRMARQCLCQFVSVSRFQCVCVCEFKWASECTWDWLPVYMNVKKQHVWWCRSSIK